MVVGERLLYAFRDPVAVALLDGIAEVLSPLGVGLLLLPGDDRRDGPSVPQLSRAALDAAVYLTGGLEDDPALEHLRRRGVPVVAVEGPVAQDLVLISIEDHSGSIELAGHLRALGHFRVAVVALPLRLDRTFGLIDPARRDRAAYRDVRERLRGIEDVFGPVPAIETAANTVEEGERAAGVLLDVTPRARPTAILAQSDLLAAGVLRAAAALGLRVPEDLSVTGFDGIDLPWLAPTRLTTVVQPLEEKGRAAGRAAAALLAGQRPADLVLPVHLRIGTTTGPAAA